MKHFKLMKGVLACLLSLALVFSCFSGVGAQAADTTTATTVTAPNAVTANYDLATNSLTASSAAYVYVLKAKTGNTIKAGKTTAKQMSTTNGVTSISMTDLGIKAENKDAYFYVCDKEFEADGTNITANFIIKATKAKKVVATIDYTKTDDIEGFNVISVKATDTKGAEIANPDVVWSTEVNGTYVGVNDEEESTTRKYANGKDAAKNGFDGRTLNEMYGSTIYVKLNGVGGASETATFPSKAVKVKIAKQGKANTMKIDVKKDTISVKNEFDFALAELDETTKEYRIVGQWHTILPYLKTATVKTIEESIVLTHEFTPLGKKDKNAGKKVATEDGGYTYSYTSLKVKSMSIEAMLDILDHDASLAKDGKYTIAVRKSASEKKPVSAVSYIEIGVQADEPLVYTQENVKGQFLVGTSTDFAKKGIVLGTIVPYPGSISGESTSGVATTGYNDSFKVGVTSNSGDKIINADNGGSSFEFAIVQQKDLVAEGTKAIDWTTVSWKKLDPAKTKITSKLNSKYNLLDGTKVKATLDTISAKSAQADFSDVKTFIVIRRAGVKSGNTRASDYIKLYVAKEGKNYNLYSTVDNGEVAYKYTIKFVKYQKNATGNDYSWQASDVEDVSVWTQSGTVKYVKLPEISGAKFYKATAASGATAAVINGTGSGEVTTSTSGYATTGSGENTVEYIAIREYANITVKQEISISGSTTKDVITYYQQKNGKFTRADGTSGEATYFVGDNFTISTSGLPTCTSSSGATVTAGSGEGITWEGNNASVTATTIKTTDEVVIVIPYTATPNYKVTFTNATTTYKDGDDDVTVTGTVTVKKGNDPITSGVTPVALGTKVTVTVTANSSSKVTSVKINGSAANVSEGVATAEITIDKDTTITITDFVAEQA